MKKLKWWFRIVGVFYLLLALMNMYFVLFDLYLIAHGYDAIGYTIFIIIHIAIIVTGVLAARAAEAEAA
ncbi:MAG: hypothetical protein IAE81_23905 [Caldilineaceae bacterium]|jgi:hypothetical protein|nr:hypothetical protein [Caldilineaceae bacterium]